MASHLFIPPNSFQNVLQSHLSQLEDMETKALRLIQECASFYRAKQDHINDVKSQINKSFASIIQKLQTKQNHLIQELDQILHQQQNEQSTLSAITFIVNQQKQHLSQASIKNVQVSNFTESKQLFESHVASLEHSMQTNNENERISDIMREVDTLCEMDIFRDESLCSQQKPPSNVYNRLQSIVKPTNNYFYQCATEPLASFVTAVNILTEYLPNKIIRALMEYVSDNDPTHCLQQGWEENDDILHDYPDIYVQNVLPIYNQPSLILTIGLPGSGKTTWGKIRIVNKLAHDPHPYVIAADDYFDIFNGGEFKPSLLGTAHEWCQKTVHQALKSGHCVIANNTNTTLQEMYAYVAMVAFGELPHKIVFAVMPETNINTLIRRGLHGVPARKCHEMLKRMRYWFDKEAPSVAAVLKAGPFRRARPRSTSKDVIYTGVFMDRQTQNVLRQYLVAISGVALLGNDTDCHLTLKFQPLYKDVDILPFGKKVRLKIIGYVTHKYVQCLMVDILDDDVAKMCANKYAHITIAFDKAVARPNYANDALEFGKVVSTVNNFDVWNTRNYDKLYRNSHDVMNGGFVVQGTVGAYYKSPNGGVFFDRKVAFY